MISSDSIDVPEMMRKPSRCKKCSNLDYRFQVMKEGFQHGFLAENIISWVSNMKIVIFQKEDEIMSIGWLNLEHGHGWNQMMNQIMKK